MKHIFIINPAAGHSSSVNALSENIKQASSTIPAGDTYEIYETKAPKDATTYVKTTCENHPDKRFRFIACGGDGTLCEVASGAIGHPNAEISVIPVGSGNDFVRAFGSAEEFLDPQYYFARTASDVDTISWELTLSDGSVKAGTAVNMCNIGFDAAVVVNAAKVKRVPLLGGPLSYILGVLTTLIKKPVAQLSISLDNGDEIGGEFLLCTAANAAYCGGGYFASPLADVRDGSLDFITIRNMTRRFFIGMLNKYRAGTHLEEPALARYITRYSARKIAVNAEKPVSIAVDGEVYQITGAEFEVNPRSVNFAVSDKSKAVGKEDDTAEKVTAKV